jgi:hypothetical protein
MADIKTVWESTEPNPDEGHLKALWDDEVKGQNKSFAEEKKHSKKRQERIEPLIKSSAFSKEQLKKLAKESKDNSKKSLEEAEKQLVKPPVDFTVLHQKDMELTESIAKKTKSPGNPHWQGYIMSPSCGGWWSCWNGESEEIPNVTFNLGAKRFDPRAQSWGEGWWDSDFSETHAYLTFRFRPPSWGHLHIHVCPWVHGYYSLYSNDEWYNGEYAKSVLKTWVDLHQNFWRSRQYRTRFALAGDELHPTRSGRIDSRYCHIYYTSVGESDMVTIRVGVNLYCRARASGGRARLDFQAGAANYIYVPYVYWYLHH